MKAKDIYEKYKLPKILSDHMLRVAAVGRIVTEALRPQMDLDIDIVTKELLLHDMGNLIKIPVENNPLFTHEEQIHLKTVRDGFVEKYGNEEHLATETIIAEIGVPEKVVDIIKNTGSSKLHITIESPDWYYKVCSYADFRISPHGIVTVRERFDEVMKRYEGREHVLADIEKTKKKKELAVLLENQLQEKSNISLENISSEEVEKLKEELKTFEI